jgi:hypothetical protein
MPLVVPGINNTSGSEEKKSEWMNKLVGKKLTDSSSDSTVSSPDQFYSAGWLGFPCAHLVFSLLLERISRNNIELSRRAPCSPRISIQTGAWPFPKSQSTSDGVNGMPADSTFTSARMEPSPMWTSSEVNRGFVKGATTWNYDYGSSPRSCHS